MVRNLVFFDPPLGEIHLHKLLSLARKRLQFLQLITESMTFDELSEILSQTHEDLAEAVSCGSKKDRISHFALALAAQVDPEFQAFLLKKETLFLKLRLSQSSEADQVQALTRMAHHLKLRTRLRHDLELFRLFTAIAPICDKELWQDVQVPFQWVSQLVSDRRVSLVNGLAQIDITLCPDLLLSLFSSLKKMDWNDSRATDSMPQKDDLVSDILRAFYQEQTHTPCYAIRSKPITLRTLQKNISFFPPCYKELFDRLVRDKRLPHSARISFTLFLKEIGLSFEESVQFWRRFYSQESKPSSTVSCCHSWQNHEKKLMYSIRHLYGLVGGRKNYSAHSCAAICRQSLSSPSEMLLCPFLESAQKVDGEQSGSVWIVEANRQCQQHLAAKLITSLGLEDISFTKPSKYYAIASQD
ncbi:uncharacterized protein LOC131893103 [Tigriopus californicus]|uniref:uncharacterized protein LOC131893103 n=1 Tax=Tigriopus californicus TaxID=6832 RepID=UPI0027DA9528|nr:uncharacterized protein LOC131893103 [Tigriopus californicus]